MKPQFAILSLVVACQFLSACSGSGQGTNKSPLAPQLQEMGTGDGGGGNAINFKMLESHLINPMDMDLVKNRVNPALQKMFNEPENTTNYNYFAMKNWYLAPIVLKTIPKEVLGIEFTADRHQQVAIQTEHAVWIDSNIFEKMTEDEKARLLVHEVLMGVYLTRFETLENLCASVRRMTDEKACEGFTSNIAKLPQYQPEQKRKLNEGDYEKIRAMTAWFFRNEADLSLLSYEKQAKKIGFMDKRFDNKIAGENLEISQKDLMLALEKARISGRFMSTCKAVETQKTFACELSWEYSSQAHPTIPNYKIDFVLFTIKDSITKKVIQHAKTAYHETSIHYLSNMSPNTYIMTLVPFELMGTQQAGYQESMILVAFDIDHSGNLNLKNLLFSPRTFVQSTTIEEKHEDSGLVYVCEKRSIVQPHPRNLETDLLFLNTFEKDDAVIGWAKLFNIDDSKNCRVKE